LDEEFVVPTLSFSEWMFGAHPSVLFHFLESVETGTRHKHVI